MLNNLETYLQLIVSGATNPQKKEKISPRMGTEFSAPIPNYGENFEYVGMVMRQYDKFILLHANKDVVDAVTNIVR